MHTPKAIIFDMGDTLLRVTRWEVEAGAARMIELAKANPRGATADDWLAEGEALTAHLRAWKDPACLEFNATAFHRLMYGKLGLKYDITDDQLELAYWQACFGFEPESGIYEALAMLKQRGIAIAVISNISFSGAVLNWEMDQHDLLSPFAFVMASSDYGLRKPHPMLFEVAAARLDLAPADCWYIGDKPWFDVVGAKRAGMTGIWYDRIQQNNRDDDEPDAVLHGWSELETLLDINDQPKG